MFAILFGLSMDYEVFLVSQMHEHYSESGDASEAVVDGLAQTGKVITSAALVMVCVFSSFVLNGDPIVKEFGIGLSVAIAVDATIVRCLLVPAVMELLGKRAWWLPHWLDRILPHFSIEGAEYFAAIDARAGAVSVAPPAGSVSVAEPAGQPRTAVVDGQGGESDETGQGELVANGQQGHDDPGDDGGEQQGVGAVQPVAPVHGEGPVEGAGQDPPVGGHKAQQDQD
jgi:hypothetical protein